MMSETIRFTINTNNQCGKNLSIEIKKTHDHQQWSKISTSDRPKQRTMSSTTSVKFQNIISNLNRRPFLTHMT